MQLLQRRAGLDPQLLTETVPQLAIGSQSVGLATTAIERRDALRLQLLPQGMLRSQTVDLGKGVGVQAHRQRGFDPEPTCGLPHLFQPCGQRSHEPEICHIGQHLAAPQTERPLQLGRRLGIGTTAHGLAAGVQPALEDRRVDGRASGVESVAARLGHQDLPRGAVLPIRLEHLPKVENIRLHRRDEPARRLLAP